MRCDQAIRESCLLGISFQFKSFCVLLFLAAEKLKTLVTSPGVFTHSVFNYKTKIQVVQQTTTDIEGRS